jgi:hypothetical protein
MMAKTGKKGDAMGTPAAAPATAFNPNPISNPTHPAHADVSRHLGTALGHSLIGDHETARQHLHAAIDKMFVPPTGGKETLP